MIVPFKKEHLEVMDIRELEKNILSTDSGNGLFSRSIAFTGTHEGRVIACGGLEPIGHGNANLWLIPSIYTKDCPMMFAREVKKWILNMREELALNRLQTVSVESEEQTKWLTFLGFTNETPEGMKKYCNGQTFQMWGQIWS